MDGLNTDLDEEDSRRKRRAIAQGQKACNPCRRRKVRCNFDSPCRTCVERMHPHLCTYDAPLKRVSLNAAPSPAATYSADSPATAAAGGAWTPSKEDWDRLTAKVDRLERSLQAVRRDLPPVGVATHQARGNGREVEDEELDSRSDQPDSDEAGPSRDMHAVHPLTGGTVFLGGNSVPAMAVALSRANDSEYIRQLLDKSVMPIFTLENDSTMYPFVDLWGLPHASTERIENLCNLLPVDSECLQYLRQYRDTIHVIYPAIIDMQRFEADATRFLIARSTRANDPSPVPFTDQNVYGKDVHWLGLLFACLASGCQCSSMPRRERQLTSQVYVCCAYECLRIINYLSCPQLDDIQNLLILGNVTSNNMNAGVAWVLLGLTIRLAQSMGLHHASPAGTCAEEADVRREVWKRIIWQDSLLSISYDRATPIVTMTWWEPARPPGDEGLPYTECMLRLCKIVLDVVSRRSTPAHTHNIQDRQHEIQAVEAQARPHLRDLSACTSARNYLEHWNWRMHRSYVVAELCRPVLMRPQRGQSRHGSTASATTTESLRAACIAALADTVDAFLGLHDVTAFARTSWAAVHRSLSSALLLGILKEPARSPRVHGLLSRLIAVLSSREYSDNVSEVPAPITRAVDALLRLNVVPDGPDGAAARVGAEGLVTSASMSSPSSADPDRFSPHAQMLHILWGGGQMPSFI